MSSELRRMVSSLEKCHELSEDRSARNGLQWLGLNRDCTQLESLLDISSLISQSRARQRRQSTMRKTRDTFLAAPAFVAFSRMALSGTMLFSSTIPCLSPFPVVSPNPLLCLTNYIP